MVASSLLAQKTHPQKQRGSECSRAWLTLLPMSIDPVTGVWHLCLSARELGRCLPGGFIVFWCVFIVFFIVFWCVFIVFYSVFSVFICFYSVLMRVCQDSLDCLRRFWYFNMRQNSQVAGCCLFDLSSFRRATLDIIRSYYTFILYYYMNYARIGYV